MEILTPAESTLSMPGRSSLNASYLSWRDENEIRAHVASLTDEDLPWVLTWAFWAEPAQTPPDGDWHSWLFLGGRGAGKTRAGAEWISGLARKGLRFALVGASLHDVREVMIEGPSGLKAIAGSGDVPRYEASRRRLVWPGGGVAYAFSAEDPDSLRGPQFHYAWADEFCAWRWPEETLAMLRLGLRLGPRPRLCVTTTPKPIAALRRLMGEPGVAVTRMATWENKHLDEGFVDGLEALYGGTRLAAQELEGQVVDGGQALWRADELAQVYGPRPDRFDEVVVGVDPPAGTNGDACGIVVAGRVGERGYVLEDATVSGATPLAWSGRVVDLAHGYGARIVAEANQGGDMVRTVLATAGCEVAIQLVHARSGKRARAEPVAALYEQGRVRHCPGEPGRRFVALEEELMAIGEGGRSPDRADALVWALTALLVTGRAEPRVRAV